MHIYTALMIGGLGAQELLIIFGILLLLFGSAKLPKLAKGLGQSINEFKRGVRDIEGDVSDERPRELKP